ncbi:MAG TPA: hypothetical protein VGJ39_11655 [Vicinamibacterales bacterium]
MPVGVTKGPLPIVVAVTGHVDLRPEDTTALGNRVRQLFRELQTKYPHTELELLTPLAEGADRLAARVALDLGIKLIAVLPMEADEYKKDFADAASIREFDELGAAAAQVFVVPGPAVAGDPRPECYTRVGAFNVQHCHVLMALWNGVATDKPGGTADIVGFRLQGVPAEYAGFVRLLDPIDTGLVHHIVTPRRSTATTAGELFARRLLAPDGDAAVPAAEAALHRICASTDTFNAFAGNTTHGVAERRQRSERDLCGSGLEPARPDLLRIVTLFACADELAIRFQSHSNRAVKILFALAFGGIAAFEAYAHLDVPQAVVPYILLSVLAYALYVWAGSRGLDEKHLDYRALAEGLRVQFYWRLAGIRSSAAEYYMRYRLEESEWIRRALRACDLFGANTQAPLNSGAADSRRLGVVITEWVEAQHAFFAKAERRDQSHLHALERRASLFARLSLLGAAVFVGLSALEHFELIQLTERQHHAVVVATGVLAAAAAAIHGYAEKLALGAHIKRYARMKGLFRSALRILKEKSGDGTDAQTVLLELGREALEENADWVMLHRDRPLELPTH